MMPRGWAGCWWLGIGDTSVGSAPNVCRGWVLAPRVLLMSFCWLLMACSEEGSGPEVSCERLQLPVPCKLGMVLQDTGTAKAPMGTRMAREGTQPCQGMQA